MNDDIASAVNRLITALYTIEPLCGSHENRRSAIVTELARALAQPETANPWAFAAAESLLEQYAAGGFDYEAKPCLLPGREWGALVTTKGRNPRQGDVVRVTTATGKRWLAVLTMGLGCNRWYVATGNSGAAMNFCRAAKALGY